MIRFVLAAGAAKAANGLQRQIAVTLNPGKPFALGADLSLTIASTFGNPTFSGEDFVVTATIEGGAATAS